MIFHFIGLCLLFFTGLHPNSTFFLILSLTYRHLISSHCSKALHCNNLLKYWPHLCLFLWNSDYCIYKCWSCRKSPLSNTFFFSCSNSNGSGTNGKKRMWWNVAGDWCITSYCSHSMLVSCEALKSKCILPQAETLQESSKKTKTGIHISTESWQIVCHPWWWNFLLYLCRKPLEVRECGFYLDGKWKKNQKWKSMKQVFLLNIECF